MKGPAEWGAGRPPLGAFREACQVSQPVGEPAKLAVCTSGDICWEAAARCHVHTEEAIPGWHCSCSDDCASVVIGCGTGQVSTHRLPGKIMGSWGELGTGSHSHALLPTPVTASPLSCSCSTSRFCRAAVPECGRAYGWAGGGQRVHLFTGLQSFLWKIE